MGLVLSIQYPPPGRYAAAVVRTCPRQSSGRVRGLLFVRNSCAVLVDFGPRIR